MRVVPDPSCVVAAAQPERWAPRRCALNARKEFTMSAGQGLVRDAVTRRALLGTGVVSAVLAAGGSVFAQQPSPAQQAPRVK
jgi:hypothetical protein